MEPKKRVGIWIRVSTEFQVKDDSPEHHERRARMYAEAKGWDIIEVYRLEAISGKTVMEQAETKRMLRDIRSKKIDGLIFSKLARLARNTKELLEFSEIFREEHADLISLAENIDTSSPSGRLFFTIIAAMAEWERAEIADRVAASVPIRAKMGKPLGGQAPFGYQWIDKELVIDEKEAPIVKLMFELFAENRRKGTVARTLNERGYRTRKGSLFSVTTIGRLLRDSTLKGSRRANYTKSLGDGKKWELKPESEWFIIPCPAIITEELWDECNRILDSQETKRKPPGKKPVYLFAGIVLCECGGKMYVKSGRTRYACQKCKRTRIDINDLEEIYYENLKSFLLTDEHITEFLTKADTIITEKEQQLETLFSEKKRITKEMDTLLDLHLSGEIPKDGFGRRYNPLDEQVQQIETSIPEIQAEIDFLKIEYLNSDTVMHDAKNLYDRWPSLELEAKRQIVEQITDCITIGGSEISIRFSYNPTFFKNPDNSSRNLRGSYWQST